jgi:hypothetical protein
MSGEFATHTPPYPTAIPDGIFNPSAKMVILSTLPSPSVSSRILMRSRPGPAECRGYSRLSVTQMRPRSSNVIATGLTRSGSAATNSTWNPSGTFIRAIASAGDRAGPGGRSWPWGICRAGFGALAGRIGPCAKAKVAPSHSTPPRSAAAFKVRSCVE